MPYQRISELDARSAAYAKRRSRPERLVPQSWPADRRFRILSLDGGGIRGIFPAAILAGLESSFTEGESIAGFFDLIVGTSTGGILALGLGAGIGVNEMLRLYVDRGCEVFPPYSDNYLGRARAWCSNALRYAFYRYDQAALRKMLQGAFGARRLAESKSRLCVPSFDGKHGSVYIYKTPHHPRFTVDGAEFMVTVGLATAAAPTYFQPLAHAGYTLVDGGVWANNPIMLGLVEALTCFEVDRSQIDILSIGCGDERYVVSASQKKFGGIWHWRTIFNAASSLQSASATNQARLLLGPPSVMRLDAPTFSKTLDLDDWRRSRQLLPPAAEKVVREEGAKIATRFLREKAAPFSTKTDAVDRPG